LSASSTSSDLAFTAADEDKQQLKRALDSIMQNSERVRIECFRADPADYSACVHERHGDYSIWTFSPTLSLKPSLEMSFFNETLGCWASIVEPVEDEGEQLREGAETEEEENL